MENKKKKIIFCLILLSTFYFLFSAPLAQAASLYFSPSSGSYAIGSNFSVSVYVSSADQAMNAASGVISFPSDKLETVSISKTGSIISLWVQEPSFSQGAVNFEGIILNPGFAGASGKIITANFKVKAAGAASILFSSGSVLANDGNGTNILTSLGNAQFSLAGPASGAAPEAGPTVPEATTPSLVLGAPSAPQISSPTYPDPNKWYNNSNPKFIWSLSNDITAARLLYDKFPNSQPAVSYVPPIAEKELDNLKDGIYYFHVQLKNQYGWGGISHFRFQIDTQPPEPFEIKFIDGNETENPKPTVLFDTTDSLSGIDYYKIKIGEGDFFSVATEIAKSNPYTLPLQNPGKRSILVQAFDCAGNYTTAVEEFVIKPIETPKFTDYSKELQSGEPLIVRGLTYANINVIIWLQKEKDDPKSFTVESDADGKFTFVADEKLKDGIYKLWAEAVDGRGARSLPSEKLTIVVTKPVIFRVGTWAVSFLAIVIPLVALAILLLFVVWYAWHKFSLLRNRLRKEVREAEQALHKTFDLLKDDVREQIKMLEKTRARRKLTQEEEKIIERLTSHLDDAEKFIKKEIEDIEKEVK